MFASYLKVIVYQLLKNRLYAFINIAGLAAGLAACLIIGLFVRHELSYDIFHPDADRIYRVSRDFYETASTPEMLLATNAPPAARLLKEDFPEVEDSTRINAGFNIMVSYEDVSRFENNIKWADSNVFSFFNFSWLAGDPGNALMAPGTVVLTESMAQRWFGEADPLGKTLELQYDIVLEVTGVIADLPENTHLSADAFASITTLSARPGADFETSWGSNTFYTFLKLEPGASAAGLVSAFPAFMDRHIQQNASASTGMSMQSLTDIHLHSSHLQIPVKAPGDFAAVMSFIAVAVCILLIACVNFMNLSVARSAQRGREVGMRKAIGARRVQVIGQFLGESILSALLALILAVVMVELALPVFNSLLDSSVDFNLFAEPVLFAILLGMTLTTGLLAGAYPAFYLSSFNSSRVLRGDIDRGKGGQIFRNALVILQFSAAIALVVTTLVVYTQLQYAQSLDMGFDNEQMLIVDNQDARWQTLKSELSGQPNIIGMTASNMAPGENNANAMMVRHENGDPAGRGMQYLLVDYDFFSTYDIDILAGREFSPDFSADRVVYPTEEQPGGTGGFILSEMAVRQIGWSPDDAIGKWFELELEEGFTYSIRGPVVGVVSDIHFESVSTPIEPVAYMLPSELMFGLPALTVASIRLAPGNLDETLKLIDETWAETYPRVPITRSFLDDNFSALYSQQENLGSLFAWFSGLAIVIASLGLYGLASFNAERRTKEIGVRKVMGGSVWSIVVLLTNDFSKLVLLSNLIAWPVAYIAMNRWLENFAYRIDLTPLVFIGSGLIALCIAWVTVGGTAAKAASQKPVLALRYE